jgi:hypothetical protein
MRKGLITGLMILFFLVHFVHAVVPQKWELRSRDDFMKGKFKGISVSEDGLLSLAPREDEIKAPPEEFFLSSVISPEGDVYLGTGHGGKIYKISSSGQAELYFQVPEMDIYCLALDKKGRLYAGASPNGRIYRITDKGKGGPFFNPEEKYIWDLLFTDKDILLAAVGEAGAIYEINQEGEGSAILKAEQNHILCLRMDKNGDLIAGSGGKGLLYRLTQGKRTSILFESPYEEIKSIALDDKGNIYAAASGEVTAPKRTEISPAKIKDETEVTLTVTPPSARTKVSSLSEEKQPSAIYRINPAGVAKRVWHSEEDLTYSLIWDEREKRIIFGTGNKGRIYALSREDKFSLLLQRESEQVYSLVPSDSRVYVLSNNPSGLTVLHSEQREEGEYLSQVYDTKTVSSWGRIEWNAELPTGGSIQFQTRSGNSAETNQSWSDWSPPYQKEGGEQILSPKARYIQFKVLFKTQSGTVSPLLSKVFIFFLQANLEPVITRLELLPPNQVFLKPPEQDEVIWGEDVDISQKSEPEDKRNYFLAKKTERMGFQTVIWDASDENEDRLIYNIYLKREDDRQWIGLKENWGESIFAFDTVSFPDGVYLIKVEVTDSPSNPLGMELNSERISSPLTIDNSLPVVKNFQAAQDKNTLTVTFSAEDTMSSIQEVLYIIRPDKWRSVFPLDGICDSKQEEFKFNITMAKISDRFVTLKVKDSQGNTGVYRYSF